MKFFYDKYWILLTMSFIAGLTIGWIDTRPHWNDTGVTVGLIFISSLIIGLLAKRNVWVLAVIIGLCITSLNYILHNNLQSAISFIIAIAGAYSGVLIRFLIPNSHKTN